MAGFVLTVQPLPGTAATVQNLILEQLKIELSAIALEERQARRQEEIAFCKEHLTLCTPDLFIDRERLASYPRPVGGPRFGVDYIEPVKLRADYREESRRAE